MGRMGKGGGNFDSCVGGGREVVVGSHSNVAHAQPLTLHQKQSSKMVLPNLSPPAPAPGL